MTLSTSELIFSLGLWAFLLIGCALFLMLAIRFRRAYIKEFHEVEQLKKAAAKAQQRSDNAGRQQSTRVAELEKQVASLQAELKTTLNEAKAAAAKGEKAEDYADLNDKYEKLQSHWGKTNLELIRAEAKVAELLGANKAMEQDLQLKEQQIEDLLKSNVESADASTLREMIINFTEESRELLQSIESLTAEKEELSQQVEYMEQGNSGNTGKILGLQRKLDDAEAALESLRAAR